MKYALLTHKTPELATRRKDQSFPAAGKAYGEALQAAGVFIGGAGLESSEAATRVLVRDGKRRVHDGPYPERKEFLAGFHARRLEFSVTRHFCSMSSGTSVRGRSPKTSKNTRPNKASPRKGR